MTRKSKSSFSKVRFLQGSFSNVDQFAEATSGWDLKFRQLDCGELNSRLAVIMGDQYHLMHVGFDRSFHQTGSTLPGARSFGFLDPGVSGVSWYDRDVDDRGIFSFHPGGEFEAVSRSGFGGFTLSYKKDWLAAVAETLEIDSIDKVLGDVERLGTHTDGTRFVQKKLSELFSAVRLQPELLAHASVSELLKFDIPATLVSTFLQTPDKEWKPPTRLRDKARRQAVTLIQEQAADPPGVQELCMRLGISWRTLDYAFREHFGVSPKRFIKLVRLNAAHRQLIKETGETTVAEVANRWGFWHMGQFAANYRKMFGRLPSSTLDHQK